MDKRFLQSNREARWAMMLTLAYLIGWLITAYLPDSSQGITGLPLWFEWSCLFLPLIFIVLCVMMVKIIFKDMPLEDSDAD
ncbi:YhdT family protein [Moellerella wisconsensis]|uniref:YhdT family protein n=1 Tax=Moellerella wisconsensis TaxID=158849 RepID=UPI0030763D45